MYPSKRSKQNRFLALILLFVAFDVLCDNYLAGSFSNETPIRQFLLIGGLLILQIFISPLQAGISDFYGRKLSLIVSLTFSLLSLIFVYLYDLHILAFLPSLILINLSKGVFGNTVPIAWAAVGDMEGRDFRFSFAKATASYAVGYLILIFLNKTFSNAYATLLLIIAFVFALFLCVGFFFDLKDIKYHKIKQMKISFPRFISNEISLIIKDIKDRSNQYIFLAWILWEVSIYAILVLYADFVNYESSLVEILMMIGYLCGTYSIKFLSHIEDSRMIRIGYKISVASLVPYFILSKFVTNVNGILAICYFFHAIGNALISPTLFSIISKRREAHERGKIYGLAESADTIAFLIAAVAIVVYKFYKMDVFFLVCFSFITACVSWIPYRNFEKLVHKDPSSD
jgi:MFS family permease